MTKSEYFEKNNVSFAKAMELFNKQKEFKSFDKFLASKHITFKYKIGDLVVLQLNEETGYRSWDHNVVFEIIGTDEAEDEYKVKFLTPSTPYDINDTRTFSIGFLERNVVLY